MPKSAKPAPKSAKSTPKPAQIAQWVASAIASTPVFDLHTHLYPPSFGRFMLWGIDELLTYHYLVAETMRVSDMPTDAFWALSKPQQADHIWQKLFLERAPISEACRGVITVLRALGLDPSKPLSKIREFFRRQTPEKYTDLVFKLANVHTVVMTNDPLDPAERQLWLDSPPTDPRFKAVLRIDPLLAGWPGVADSLNSAGYSASADLSASSMQQIRRFLSDWIDRMRALYVAASLTPAWRYPDDSPATKVIDEAILPVTREKNIPFALMIGVQRQVNPALKLAGDSVGKSDITSVDRLLARNPANKVLLTMLSRENQHELVVTARKHRNAMVFGCWWFLNNPSLIDEITRMRVELLGTSFIPQHSDARILDQIIYKWTHSRRLIATVLTEKFQDLATAGWAVTKSLVDQTVQSLLSGNFEDFLKAKMPSPA